MLIAFEGPDNTGKSTSAGLLSSSGSPIYNATKDNHRALARDMAEPGAETLVETFDRIDWFSHMVYRLALPEHEWNDERPRTVFAMPDTHLVVKVHNQDNSLTIDDELYDTGTLAYVNPLYLAFAKWLSDLNEVRNYSLFKSVTILEIFNNQSTGGFQTQLVRHVSPGMWWTEPGVVDGDRSLLNLLRSADQHAG